MKSKRLTALILIGVALAVTVPLVAAYVSNAWTVTIHPSPNIAVNSSLTEYTNGDTIDLIATLTNIPDGTIVTFKADGVAIGTATSSGGIATLSTTAVNTGTEDKVVVYTASTP